MGQLIILGNGFDLSCGLKSSFQDFLYWRRLVIDTGGAPDSELNAFDIILGMSENEHSQWADVESAMQDLFIGDVGHESLLDTIYNDSFAFSYELIDNGSTQHFDSQHPLCQLTKTKMALERAPMKDVFVTFLREELARYETSFCQYLQQEVKSKGGCTYPELRTRSKKS